MTGTDTSIRELAETVMKTAGFTGKTVGDITKPDEQLRRYLDISKAREKFRFAASTSLQEGVKKMMDWRAHRNSARNVV